MANETNSKLQLDSYVQAARRGDYKIAHIKHEDDEVYVRQDTLNSREKGHWDKNMRISQGSTVVR
jgi:hypothetical protein